MTSFLSSPRLGWIAVAAALAAIMAIQIWAGLTLRGLYADGAFYAEQLLLRHAFTIVEPSRWTSEVLMQAPVILAMRLGHDSPHAVALAFSLTSNLLPLALTLACLAVLPAADRTFGLFPVAIFLAASMSAAFASVADGPTAAAYAWLLLLLILFGRLTRWRLGAILLLAAGAVRLHEEMAFLGPILSLACLLRCLSAKNRISRVILVLAAVLVMAGCAVAIHYVLHPQISTNRTSFVRDLISLRWLLLGDGQISIMALAGLVGILAAPVVLLSPRRQAAAITAMLIIFVGLAMLALAIPPCPPAAFAARDNACLLTAPAMLLLLVLRGGDRRLPPASMAFVAMLGLTIAAADGAATYGWQGYTKAMRTTLRLSHGVVPWRDAMTNLAPAQETAALRYGWPWTTPLMSFWIAPGPMITSLIANPDEVTWQPFDPEVMRSALTTDAPALTRLGFVTLLEQYKVRWHHPIGLFALWTSERD
jgi:hypothetical protein